MPKLMLRRKGCLVLFSSRKQMTEVCEGMPEDIKEHILMQTTMPKTEIVPVISCVLIVASQALSSAWPLSVKAWTCLGITAIT